MTRQQPSKLSQAWRWLVMDESQHKPVIVQRPNLPIIVWVASTIAAHYVPNRWQHGISELAIASLLTWAYLEITSGASRLRRLLGLMVLVAQVVSLFASS